MDCCSPSRASATAPSTAGPQRDLKPLFPHLPERTRLFRLLAAHKDWTQRFLAQPTLLGVADSFGVELLHPWRLGRSDKQIGKKCYSNHRWIVGGKLGFVLNRFGQVCAWDGKTANTHDSAFQPLIQKFDGRMLVLADTHFHQEGGRSAEPEGLQARRLERPHGDRDGAVHAGRRMPLQARRASGLALLRDAAGVYDGRVQHLHRLGRDSEPMRTALCRFRWHSSACKTSTIG